MQRSATSSSARHGVGLATAAILAALMAAGSSPARVLIGVDEALGLAFPGCDRQREAVYLTEPQLVAVAELSGESVASALATRYVVRCEGRLAGTAYLDTHLVRTLEETVLVVVRPDGTIGRVEVISFREPPDYLPREGWYRQFDGRRLDGDLGLDRAIRAVTGATLTARATTSAVRRVLALHRTLDERPTP